jgi:hypothetical protein
MKTGIIKIGRSCGESKHSGNTTRSYVPSLMVQMAVLAMYLGFEKYSSYRKTPGDTLASGKVNDLMEDKILNLSDSCEGKKRES